MEIPEKLGTEIITIERYQCLGCGSIVNPGQIHVCPRSSRVRRIKQRQAIKQIKARQTRVKTKYRLK